MEKENRDYAWSICGYFLSYLNKSYSLFYNTLNAEAVQFLVGSTSATVVECISSVIVLA